MPAADPVAGGPTRALLTVKFWLAQVCAGRDELNNLPYFLWTVGQFGGHVTHEPDGLQNR